MPKHDINEANIYFQREKILADFVVKKYDESSDANITDKAPYKKVLHENTMSRRKKGGLGLG